MALLILFCCINLATGFVSAGLPHFLRTTELRGGCEYSRRVSGALQKIPHLQWVLIFCFLHTDDATVGINPSAPIQFFTLPGNTCPYAQRTHITLKELGLEFDTTEVTGMPKPDWYLNQINPRGKVREEFALKLMRVVFSADLY